jgi:hypothetical protein
MIELIVALAVASQIANETGLVPRAPATEVAAREAPAAPARDPEAAVPNFTLDPAYLLDPSLPVTFVVPASPRFGACGRRRRRMLAAAPCRPRGPVAVRATRTRRRRSGRFSPASRTVPSREAPDWAGRLPAPAPSDAFGAELPTLRALSATHVSARRYPLPRRHAPGAPRDFPPRHRGRRAPPSCCCTAPRAWATARSIAEPPRASPKPRLSSSTCPTTWATGTATVPGGRALIAEFEHAARRRARRRRPDGARTSAIDPQPSGRAFGFSLGGFQALGLSSRDPARWPPSSTWAAAMPGNVGAAHHATGADPGRSTAQQDRTVPVARAHADPRSPAPAVRAARSRAVPRTSRHFFQRGPPAARRSTVRSPSSTATCARPNRSPPAICSPACKARARNKEK